MIEENIADKISTKPSSIGRDHWGLRTVPCAICGGRRFRVLGYHGGWAHHRGEGIATRIVRCRECDFVYANPVPMPRDYSHYSDAADYFQVHDLETKIGTCRELVREATTINGGRTGKLLDIGCGRGEALVAARELGWEGEGIEPSEDFARFAQQELKVNVQQGFLEQTHYPDATFDLVFLNAVLEHVYEPLVLLREARRVLKPGGILFLDVPNEAGLYFTAGRLYYHLVRGRHWTINLSPTFKPFHVAGFSPATLKRAFGKTDFEVIQLIVFPDQLGEQHHLSGNMLRAAKVIEKVSRWTHSGSFMAAWARAV